MGIKYKISHNYGLDIKGVRAVYSCCCLLSDVDLYSGGDNDPISWTHLDADLLAKDDGGRCLPYDVTVSLFALNVDRDKHLLEDMPRRLRRSGQAVAVHMVVFDGLKEYEEYMNNNDCLIQQENN